MATIPPIHCPSFQSLVLATRGEVIARPSREPSALSIDTRDDLSGACFVAIAGDRFDGHDFVAAAARGGAALAVIERPLSDAERSQLPEGFGVLRVASTRRALGQIAHAWRRSLLRLRVVAVTGSAGKTTTRRLLEGVLAKCGPTHASPKSFNNDIGVPLTLLATPDEARFLVAEVGMNHPGELVPLAELCEPEGCIVTLAGRAHLEGLGSVEGVATEKASILSAVPSHGFAIVNGDNAPLLAAVRRLSEEGRVPDRVWTYGTGEACAYRLVSRAQEEALQRLEVRLPVHAVSVEGAESGTADRVQRFELRLPGAHNALNAVGAIAAALEMGMPIDAIREGLAAVEPSDMRLERLALGGRIVFNDAYNANPEAMIASLGAFAELAADAPRRMVLLGEMRELGATARDLHEEVGRAAAAVLRPSDALVAVGPHAEALVEAARAAGFSGRTLHAPAHSDAFAAGLPAVAPEGTSVLVKGSRGARMERFLEPFRTTCVSA